MPKSRKQKTSVKKKKKPKPQKKKTTARKKRTNRPLLESTADQEAPNTVAVNSSIEDLADASEERAGIISIAKSLEGQIVTAFKLKEVLEAELDKAQNRLAEELDARTQLEVQVKSLESRAALAEQLREDISFVEEERNKFANLLAQIQPQLEEVTAERDSLAEKMASAEKDVKKVQGEKTALEAQVMNLKDNITDSDRLQKKLAEITEAHRGSREQVDDLTRRLEATTASKNALERELAGTHQNARTLRVEVEELREKAIVSDNRIADLCIQLEGEAATNRERMAANTILENEIKMLNVNYEAAKNEVGTFKKALRDIRSEMTQTSGRVRQRHFKPKKKTK
ncbi:MAG TPA: hypothetical protein HPP66_06410 [Planctomycetes bacterium]|nr:hypothetical protein [Planctomycetota bacterium]